MDFTELMILICCAAVVGAIILVGVCAFVRYRRARSGISPHDVVGRRARSWRLQLEEDFGASVSEKASKQEPDGDEVQLTVVSEAPSSPSSPFSSSIPSSQVEERQQSIVVAEQEGQEASPPIVYTREGSLSYWQHHATLQSVAPDEAEREREPEEASNYMDAMTASLTDISSKSPSPNQSISPIAARTPPQRPSPIQIPGDGDPDGARSIASTGARSKSMWRTRLGDIFKSPSHAKSIDRDQSFSTSKGGSSFSSAHDHDSEQGETRVFTIKELSKATNGFDKRNEIGVGGFGKVYKGFIQNKYIAIKKISANSHQGVKEFVSEVSITGRMSGLRHPNLVPLLGWCQEKGELLLVYSYFPAGSLDRILHSRIPPSPRNPNPLAFEQRYKIISGVASALAFLHSGWLHCVIHRDVKTSNILIDQDNKAVLGDFGLARQHNFGQLPQTTRPAGTPGYLAPEVATSSDKHMTDKLDVYSFGAVVLEIACGRRPVDYQLDNPLLTEWVWGLHEQNRLVEASDPRLAGEFPRHLMLLVLHLGLLCSHLDPKLRPKMVDVVRYLSGHMRPPPLPAKRPILCFT